jgi:hypothetical protein
MRHAFALERRSTIIARKEIKTRIIETRSLPTLTHCFPRNFTFYVAHPIRSIDVILLYCNIALGPRSAPHMISERAGVIEAPACPQCGSKMALKKAKRGPRAGQSFWGCSRYPACHGIHPC